MLILSKMYEGEIASEHFPTMKTTILSVMRYLLEGVAVSLVGFAISRKNFGPEKAINLVLMAAMIFAILDNFTTGSISKAARWGSGFGIGSTLGVGTGTGPLFPA